MKNYSTNYAKVVEEIDQRCFQKLDKRIEKMEEFFNEFQNVDSIEAMKIFKKSFDFYRSSLKDSQIKILTLGNTSSGKSSFLNKLFSFDILPTGSNSVTNFVVNIRQTAGPSRLVIEGKQKCQELQQELSQYCDDLACASIQNYQKLPEVDLFVHFDSPIFSDHLVFIDCPGIGTENQVDDILATYSDDADLFVYLVNSVTDWKDSEREIFFKIRRERYSPHVFLLFNHWDTVLKESEKRIQMIKTKSLAQSRTFYEKICDNPETAVENFVHFCSSLKSNSDEYQYLDEEFTKIRYILNERATEHWFEIKVIKNYRSAINLFETFFKNEIERHISDKNFEIFLNNYHNDDNSLITLLNQMINDLKSIEFPKLDNEGFCSWARDEFSSGKYDQPENFIKHIKTEFLTKYLEMYIKKFNIIMKTITNYYNQNKSNIKKIPDCLNTNIDLSSLKMRFNTELYEKKITEEFLIGAGIILVGSVIQGIFGKSRIHDLDYKEIGILLSGINMKKIPKKNITKFHNEILICIRTFEENEIAPKIEAIKLAIDEEILNIEIIRKLIDLRKRFREDLIDFNNFIDEMKI